MYNFDFKKTLGQNFLKDDNIVNKIVNATEYKKNNLVIEIGPGAGALTKKLLPKVDKAILYEIDTRLERILNKELAEYDNYTIIFDDFLNRNVLDDLSNISYEHLYVIANLPYYITTPIIERLISFDISFELIRIMVQKEVGDRFCARVGTKEYGSFTVFLNYNFDVKKNFVVSRNCFFPRPNVDSVIVSLMSKDKLFVSDKELFYKLVYDSFKFKRKTLRNNLKGYDLDVVSKVLEKHGFDLSVRAEQISVDIFCEISNELSI